MGPTVYEVEKQMWMRYDELLKKSRIVAEINRRARGRWRPRVGPCETERIRVARASKTMC